MSNSMKKIDFKALGMALALTGSILVGALIGTLLVKYASPAITTTLLVLLLVAFFYFLFKD